MQKQATLQKILDLVWFNLGQFEFQVHFWVNLFRMSGRVWVRYVWFGFRIFGQFCRVYFLCIVKILLFFFPCLFALLNHKLNAWGRYCRRLQILLHSTKKESKKKMHYVNIRLGLTTCSFQPTAFHMHQYCSVFVYTNQRL